MHVSPDLVEIIDRCRTSVVWFVRNFCKIKHPTIGEIPFQPWDYQKRIFRALRENRFNITRKCRQAGVTQTASIFALWYAMFFPDKTVLIVSRRDDDAKELLRDKIKYTFDRLPEWMRELWDPDAVTNNAHEMGFRNGSKIQSLTSHTEILRSHASSFNLLDEAGFIQGMDKMWAAGWPTLQHGGSCFVVSTCNGVGNWYWSTMTDAEAETGVFSPITINWWDMNWALDYIDPLSGKQSRIAPCDGIRKCVTKEEINRYGQYVSPWLEEQYKALQEKGEVWKFRQEILAEFVGSGHTVLDPLVLSHTATTVADNFERIGGMRSYIHPITQQPEDLTLDFGEQVEGLNVWERPQKDASYVMGVDIATGKHKDYHGVEFFRVDTLEQVAELMVHCLPRELVKLVDVFGREYNNALMVVERNNGGDIVIDMLREDRQYPRLWRSIENNVKPYAGDTHGKPSLRVGDFGFFTGQASKAALNKLLIDFVKVDGGVKLRSRRLYKQLLTYVRKRDRAGRDTWRTEAEEGAGNYDDLVMALALAFVGLRDSYQYNDLILMPFGTKAERLAFGNKQEPKPANAAVREKHFLEIGGTSLLMPFSGVPGEMQASGPENEMMQFIQELGAMPAAPGATVRQRKDFFGPKK